MTEPCPPTATLPDDKQLHAAVALLAATAHPARLVSLLALAREGPLSAGRLSELAGLEQSAMSHQLRVLRDARLVRGRRRGRQVLYELADHHIAHIVEDALSHAAEDHAEEEHEHPDDETDEATG